MKKFLTLLLLALIIILSSCGGNVTDTTASDTLPLETEPQETECAHTQTYKVTKDPMSSIFTERAEQKVCLHCSAVVEEKVIPATKSLKILAIGNSFSIDATTYLWDILNAAGAEELIVGNAWIGGCSLDKHWTMAQSGEAAYSYTKYTSSGKTTATCSLKDAVTDEAWDIITLQQLSNNSGMPETYTHLSDMVEFVLDNCANIYVDINFHMTWAYQQDSPHGAFVNYGRDQMTMYNAIVDTVNTVVLKNETISRILPSGTAIQNLRTSYFGDTLTIDGSHLSLDVGRYTAALTWACAIANVSPYEIKQLPAGCAHLDEDLPAIREAVENAISKPFEITKSSFTEKKEKKELTLNDRFTNAGLDISNYEIIDWEPKLFYHWNATTSATTIKSAGIPQFIASKKFTKEELPIGTVIVVDSGYKYRPDGWQEIDKPLSGTRPSATTTYFTVVDESWWGDFNYRAFNLSKATGSEPATEEYIEHFKIYVPKN